MNLLASKIEGTLNLIDRYLDFAACNFEYHPNLTFTFSSERG
jgi:hypothetical protein